MQVHLYRTANILIDAATIQINPSADKVLTVPKPTLLG
jgi:hypothetical protein